MRAAPQTILLVEDDFNHAELIRLNLELGNVLQQIVHVTDGRQALDFLQRQGEFQRRPPSAVLVLLDLNLPNLDGREFLRQVKSCEPLRQTPVVVFAAADNPL
ncbi:MAG TPA: response regulator, partial [Bryobacterales bacterium]|nr:response regulator [Bryobacterales bacterium]